MAENPNRDWLEGLTDEDLSFVRRLVLASGSLKEVAEGYGISYPTVRLRLDRLIAKIQALEAHRAEGELERQLRGRFAEGKLDAETVKALLAAHRLDLAHARRSK